MWDVYVVRTVKIYSSSNFQVYSTALTIVTMLYIRSPELTHHIIEILFPLTTLTQYLNSTTPGNSKCTLCLYKCLFNFTYNWYHTVFIFLCLAYFTYHNALNLHPYCHKMARFPSFLWLNDSELCVYKYTQAYIYIQHFLYPFIHWQTLTCFQFWYCEECCNKLSNVYVFDIVISFSSDTHTHTHTYTHTHTFLYTQKWCF